MQKIISLTLFLLYFSFTYGQSAKEQLELVNSVKLEDVEFFKEISFQDKFGYFIIPVKIGDDVYDYIFDTGGYNTVTSEIISRNKLPNLMEVEVGSANQLKSNIILTKIPTVDIAGVQFKEIGAFNFDFKDSPQINCYTNGGLIGKSIIKNAVWQINAPEKKIVLTDDINKLDNLDNAIKLKVKLDKVFNPFVKAKINGKTKSFLLDFGYGGFISLTEAEGKSINSQKMVEVTGEGAVSANGILNENIFIKNIKSFEIGNSSIPSQVVYYSKSNNYNLIGSKIAKYFIVTLNFEEKELFLTPIEKKEEVQPKSSFGFDLNRNENNVYVSKIFKGLSADKKGLKLNDVVISINDKMVNQGTYCDFYNGTKELLKADEPIRLKVKRGNELLNIEIIKSKLFQVE
ncbi:PDZ domain-containing protein [Aquimarina gracilis]|uniref:PDZ domain-containing protein n=1 Tax=Aquimarina gracilis TaxID=874422 RepID=A0ABU5ZY43_9FLAO|nr:PDZ domain-containing protein [Aquimarina gracilis]MEB3346740.1 PDZ domain-containing protein [Aquimarina gracilis]